MDELSIDGHNPYFSRWFSAIRGPFLTHKTVKAVTILILVDGFLQSVKTVMQKKLQTRHNPYFSRWFSAIALMSCKSAWVECHNPYFSRWFSAI